MYSETEVITMQVMNVQGGAEVYSVHSQPPCCVADERPASRSVRFISLGMVSGTQKLEEPSDWPDFGRGEKKINHSRESKQDF